MLQINKFKHSLLSVLISSVLFACVDETTNETENGSANTQEPETSATIPEDTEQNQPETPVTTSLSGTVADGYLVNAKVCLDLNQNKVCDPEEPNTISGDGGAYQLDGVTQEQIEQFPILVEIIKDQTIDEDEPGVVLTKAYSLSAPAGYTFVSPLTTMVQNEVEKGQPIEKAQQLIQEKLGTTADLNEDYVAKKKDDTASPEERQEFEKLHKVAQVTARVIADNMDKLEEAASLAEIPVDALVSAIVDEVFESLEEIKTQVNLVELDGSQEFDPDSMATEVSEDLVQIEEESLEQHIDQKEAEKNAPQASIADLIQGDGVNWFYARMEHDEVYIGYGSLTLDEQGQKHDSEYRWQNGDWQLRGDDEEQDKEWVLSQDGWLDFDEEMEVIKANDDGSISLSYDDFPNMNERVVGTQIDLAGKSTAFWMQSVDGDGTWGQLIDKSLVFPEGALGFKLEFSSSEQNTYLFHDWGDCEEQYKIGDLCNSIWQQQPYDPNMESGESHGPALSLASMIVDAPVQLSGTADDAQKLNAIHVAWSENGNVVAELLQDHKVNYYKVEYSSYSNSVKLIGTGQWLDETVHGVVFRRLSGPEFLKDFDSIFRDEGQPVLFEKDGAVRVAMHLSQSRSKSMLVFNQLAKEFIVNNFDPALVPEPKNVSENECDVEADCQEPMQPCSDGSFECYKEMLPECDATVGCQEPMQPCSDGSFECYKEMLPLCEDGTYDCHYEQMPECDSTMDCQEVMPPCSDGSFECYKETLPLCEDGTYDCHYEQMPECDATMDCQEVMPEPMQPCSDGSFECYKETLPTCEDGTYDCYYEQMPECDASVDCQQPMPPCSDGSFECYKETLPEPMQPCSDGSFECYVEEELNIELSM